MKQKVKVLSLTDNPLIWYAVIAISTFIAYSSALTGQFTNWDDLVYVVDNPLLKTFSLQSISRLLTENYMGNYHPLTMLSLAVDRAIFGLNPFMFHLNNLLVHIVNSFLVLIFIRRLTGNLHIGAIAGLIFGLHTFHVESVAWISERKDVLYTMFYLLALIFYLEFIKQRSVKWFVLSLLVFLLSCLSKGQAVTLSPTLVLLDIFLGRKWLSMPVLLEKVPFFAFSLIFGIVAINAQAGADATVVANFPLYERFAIASYGLVMYILKLILPFSLSSYYGYPLIGEGEGLPVFYWFFVLPALTFIAAWVYSYKKSKVVFLGVGLFLVNIFTLLQLLPVGKAIMADRYVYVPSIGFSFLIGWYVVHQRWFSRRELGYFAIGSYALLLGFLTFQRGKVWADSVTLWSDVIEKNPEVVIAYYNRGNVYMNSDAYERAIQDFSTCVKLDPTHWEAYINRGVTKTKQKDFVSAIGDFDAALSIDSTILKAYINRANALRMLKDYDRALVDYNKAGRIKPDMAELYLNRSILKFEMKDIDGSLIDLDMALHLDSKYLSAFINRAYIKKEKGDYSGSLADYTSAIELNPGNSDLYNNRGNVYFLAGDMTAALNDYNQSIQLNPDDFLGYKNRGTIYLSQNKAEEAVNDFRESIIRNPKSAELFYNLALAKKLKGDSEGMKGDYLKAVELDPNYRSDEFRKKIGVGEDLLGQMMPVQLYEQGRSTEASGKLQEALALYRKALAARPDYPEAWFALGNLYGKLQKFDEAMNCMNNAIKYRGDYPEALATRGIAYASKGKFKEALSDLTASIAASPKNGSAYFNRAIVYLNTNQKELACSDLKMATDLGFTDAFPVYRKECLKK